LLLNENFFGFLGSSRRQNSHVKLQTKPELRHRPVLPDEREHRNFGIRAKFILNLLGATLLADIGAQIFQQILGGKALNSHASISLAYALNLGRNAQDGITLPQTREYDQQLVSVGVQYKF
jgi:hypothetical protein